jgi:hypothetical protein
VAPPSVDFFSKGSPSIMKKQLKQKHHPKSHQRSQPHQHHWDINTNRRLGINSFTEGPWSRNDERHELAFA